MSSQPIPSYGISLIKAFEGCLKPRGDGRFVTYKCPAGVVTIGWGSTSADVPGLKAGDVWTKGKCDSVFEASLAGKYAAHVDAMLRGAAVTPYQYAALVSWAYNTGGPASSSVWAAVRSGQHARVPELLSRWNKGGGRVLPGLVRRRKAEGLMYAGRVDEAMRVAGTVDPGTVSRTRETPTPTTGELVRASKGPAAAIGATGAVAAAPESAHGLPPALVYGAVAVTVIAIALFIAARWKTLRGAWA